MDDLTAFIRARLDEDEAVAKDAGERARRWKLAAFDDEEIGDVGDLMVFGEASTLNPIELRHVQRHDPARVLREVAAKRRMLSDLDLTYPDEEHMLKLLATAWADYPDYRQEWKP